MINIVAMKMRKVFTVAFILGAAVVSRAELEFSGYLTSTEGRHFLITDLDTGTKSRWLAIGEAFQGYILTGFDSAGEMLVLERPGSSAQLWLKSPATPQAGPEVSEKRQIRVIVTDTGTFSSDNEPLDLRAFWAHLEELTRSGRLIALVIQLPLNPAPKSEESVRKVLNVFRAASAKGSIVVVNAILPK